jgi:hypothetical protein
MLRRVVFVITDVSEELSAFFIRVTKICKLGTTLAVTSNRHTLRRNTLYEAPRYAVFSNLTFLQGGLSVGIIRLRTEGHRVCFVLPFLQAPSVQIFLVPSSQTPSVYVRFEVFTAVTMKNGVFWVVTPCGSCKNLRFGGTWRLLHKGDKNR